MAISKEAFHNILREAASREFSHIPEEEKADFTFSDDFEIQMEELIRARKKPWYSWVNSAAKRAAVIALAVSALLVSALQVDAIRQPVEQAVQQIRAALNGKPIDLTNKPVSLEIQGDPSMTLATRYAIMELPEGFAQTDDWYTETFVATSVEFEYENEEGVGLYFSQTVFCEDTQIVDGRSEKLAVNGKQILFLETSGQLSAYWAEEGKYMLSLDAYNGMDREVFLRIIASVKPAE